MPFLYLVLLVASVFFYILYEYAFSFYLFAFLLLVPIVLFIMTVYTSRRLKIGFIDKQNTAGRSAKLPIKLRVDNRSKLPCPNLLIEIEYCNMLDGKKSVMKINTPVYPKESQIMTLTVSGIHCGTVNFRIKRCKMSDFLKLFTLKLKRSCYDITDTQCTLTILPEYIPLENPISNYSDMGLETDEFSKTQKGDDPSEIFDIRDYVDGDKLNRIHWKLSAKQDKTMVKDYSLPISNSILIMLDLVKPKNSTDELARFDTLLETVASFSNYLLENAVPHRIYFYNNANGRSIELNITDEETHSTMLGMLLQAQLSDKPDLALQDYINTDERFRCGHLMYISTEYSAVASELMSDAELAFKYTYLLITDDINDRMTLYDEYADLIPVYSGKLADSVQELCL